jgi:uncharacterized protein (DUF427 family)
MSLTTGSGPLASEAAGSFNARLGLPERLLFDPYLPRVRALFEGETVVDSFRTRLLRRPGGSPSSTSRSPACVKETLEASETSVEVAAKGTVSYHSLRIDARTAPDAAWVFDGLAPTPPSCPATSRSSGARSTSGSPRTGSSSASRATRTAASTSRSPPGTCGSRCAESFRRELPLGKIRVQGLGVRLALELGKAWSRISYGS